MAEPKLIKFSYKELAELMVKQQGITEGHWGVYMRFGIGAVNAGETPETAVPTAFVPVLEIGLQRFDGPGPLAIDASKLAPKPE
jgi:hypothetical protein